MANEKTGTLQFQMSDGTYVAGYPKTTLAQVIGGQEAIDAAKEEAIAKSGVKTYAEGTAYNANAIVVSDNKLYIVTQDFTSTTLDEDIAAGNLVAASSSSSSSSSTASAGVQTYKAGKSYKKNDLVANNSDLYLVLKDFKATAIADDTTAANVALINSSSVSTTSSDAFMTTAEVDALFDTSTTTA